MVVLPSVRHLRHLIALAEHGHFGQAAAACHVTQSTLSASIKELENVLEAALVDRTKRRVALTPLGLETVNRARKIIAELEELAHAARAEREPLSGTVRMGVISTVGPYLLPRVLPGLRRAYGRLKLYLVEDLTARLIEDLHQGKLDVVLLALPCDCGAVETAVLFEDPFLVAFPQGHALLNETSITPQQLACENLLLLKDGHCLREHALAACSLAGGRAASRGWKRRACRPWCKWRTMGLARRCCPRSRWRPAFCEAQVLSRGRLFRTIIARSGSSGAKGRDAAMNSTCSRRNWRAAVPSTLQRKALVAGQALKALHRKDVFEQIAKSILLSIIRIMRSCSQKRPAILCDRWSGHRPRS